MYRLVTIAAATLLAAGPVAVFASGHCETAAPARRDAWHVAAAPRFTTEPRSMLGWAAKVTDPRTQVATNGSSVARTADGGCTWHEVFTAPPSPVPPPLPTDPRTLPRIALVGLTAVDDGDLMHAVVEHRPVGTGAPQATLEVHVTRDGGATWARADGGLPPVASAVQVAFAADGATGYALLSVPAPALGDTAPPVTTVLYTTTDGGVSWVASTATAQSGLRGFALAGTAELWAWDASALLHSTDGGATFAAVPAVTGPVSTVAVPPGGGKPPVVFTAGAMWRNEAGTWRSSKIPGNVDTAAYDASRDIVVGSGVSGMWAVEGGGKPRRIAPVGDEYVRGVVLGGTGFAEVWGYTAAAVFRGRLDDKLGVEVPLPPVALPTLPPIELKPGTPGLPEHPELRPASLDVRLVAGSSRRVRYTLDVPPTPTPLDVFFLIDTTGSFDSLIGALRAQLATMVNRLTETKIDAQFGVGAFREYPIAQQGAGSATSNYAYRLVRRIGPVDGELEDALRELRTGGGSSDGRTSALAAAYQAATGVGQHIAPNAVHDGYVIPKGQDARFRRGALRVVLLVTDTEPRKPAPGYWGPSVAQVTQALNAKRAQQIGLVVGKPPNGTLGPRETMEEIAKATGAVATHGVDCDEDGVVDLDPGAPLVCDLAGDGLTAAIVQMLRGVRDIADAELVVAGDEQVVAAASALVYDGVNVKAYNRLNFDVRYSCAAASTETVSPVRLTGRVGGRDLVAATARVRCVPRAVPAVPVIEPIPPPQVAVAVLPPPPPPPIVNQIPNPNVNANPNPNPNPQANPNAQAGAAAQERDQIQLALVNEDLGARDSQEDLAMTALAWGTAAAMACAYGGAVVVRRRRAGGPAPAPARATVRP